MVRTSWFAALPLAVAALAIASPVVARAAPAAAGPAGSVKGSVSLDGPAPERTKIRRDTDPYCGKTEQLSDDVIVTHGKLKDVLVRVKNGSFPIEKSAPPPVPALLDQKDCTYAPHVLGIVAGQKLLVRNSDGTFHNVHGTVHDKTVWNQPAITGAPDVSLDTPTRPGDVIDIVCDVHPWMHAYAVVQDHGKFAVTGEDGAFELRDLPPGTYTIEAWHPTLGLTSTTVKVGKTAATANLAYKRGAQK